MTNEREYEERFQRFEEPIKQIAMHNAVVHRTLKAYARGEIVTKEEALCQMVVGLTKSDYRGLYTTLGQRRMERECRSAEA